MKKIYLLFISAFAVMSALTSCVEDVVELESASLMYSIEIDMAVEDKVKIYVDETESRTLPMLVGESIQLSYITNPEDQSELTHPGVAWSSSNEAVVSISPEGKLTAVSEGVAVVTVTPSTVNLIASASLKVTVFKTVTKATSIEITAITDHVSEMSDYPSCYAGDTLTLVAKVKPDEATYKTVLWSSKDPETAVVDPISGAVVGVKPGEAEIVATALDEGKVTASQKVYIDEVVMPQGLKVTNLPGEDEVYSVGDGTWQFDVETIPAKATKSRIVWESDNPAVATVDNGKVTFNMYGKVNITATCPESDAALPEEYAKKVEFSMNIPAGYYRETFEDPDLIHWKVNSSGAALEHRIGESGESYLYFTPGRVDAATLRGDIMRKSPTFLSRDYPILCFRMDDVGDLGYSRSIKFDTSGGTEDGARFGGELGGGNCKWKTKYKCSDGSSILVYDLSSQNFPTGGLLPTGKVGTFTTFQFKYADIRFSDRSEFPADPGVHYRLFWFQSFRSEDEMKEYLAEWSDKTLISWGDYIPGQQPGNGGAEGEDPDDSKEEPENPGSGDPGNPGAGGNETPEGGDTPGDGDGNQPGEDPAPTIPVGSYAEFFESASEMTWSMNSSHVAKGAKQEFKTNDKGEGYIEFTPYVEGKGRGDIFRGTTSLSREYPIICIRIDDVADRGFTRNITLDVVGTESPVSGGLGGKNNKWNRKYKCSDGSALLIYDLSVQNFENGGLLEEGVVATFDKTFQLKYADINRPEEFTADDIKYRLFWFCTFAGEDEMNVFLSAWSSETGITYNK